DPVFSFSESDCDVYVGSLNYDPVDPFANTNGIGIYKTDVATLLSGSCDPDQFSDLSDEDCWPTRRYAAFSADPTHFFDKEWFDVGDTGDGEHVWVTYSDFDFTPTPPNPAGFTAEIFAVRCDAELTTCTAPLQISNDVDVQFSDVTIGPDQRTYLTWAKIEGELTGDAQTFTIKMRVAEPGATTFGPEQIVFVEDLAIPFGGFLHANDFRVDTYPKHEVRDLGGAYPRVYVVWDACTHRVIDVVCEEPVIWLSYSDDLGATWSDRVAISDGGDNYFPSIAFDPEGNRLVAAWFTNRFDAKFHNRQDVELVRLSADGTARSTHRLTRPSNETEADPLLGGFFIGDYIEVFAQDRTAWVGYNANYRQRRLLFEGIRVTQQDNYLTRVGV
ncbi:MAG TPA: sialidase family protein, partial [Actinomycetota bacterium]|nr:sialidase family protein [Actinomycetota bacterium]